MLRKIAAVLLAPLLCMAFYHYAFADGLFTEEYQACVLAHQELKEAYGLNQNLLAYFNEVLTENYGGKYTFVYYPELDDLDYVLGRYTVTVDGTEAKAAWSWDGKDVPNQGHGLAAHAWGKDQLTEIWLINKETSNMQNYGLIARGIAMSAGHDQGYISPLPESVYDDGGFSVSDSYDPSKAKISAEESRQLALKALKAAYGLSDEQISSVTFDDEAQWYEGNAQGEPVMYLTCLLWNDSDWMEGNGNYYVTVNQATGLIESISFIDGIIGNG